MHLRTEKSSKLLSGDRGLVNKRVWEPARVSWCLGSKLVSTERAGAYRMSWCLQNELVSMERACVYGTSWCLQNELVSTEQAGVYRMSLCLQNKLVSTERAGVYRTSWWLESKCEQERSSARQTGPSSGEFLGMSSKHTDLHDLSLTVAIVPHSLWAHEQSTHSANCPFQG